MMLPIFTLHLLLQVIQHVYQPTLPLHGQDWILTRNEEDGPLASYTVDVNGISDHGIISCSLHFEKPSPSTVVSSCRNSMKLTMKLSLWPKICPATSYSDIHFDGHDIDKLVNQLFMSSTYTHPEQSQQNPNAQSPNGTPILWLKQNVHVGELNAYGGTPDLLLIVLHMIPPRKPCVTSWLKPNPTILETRLLTLIPRMLFGLLMS